MKFVDKSLCIWCGACVSVAEKLFKFGEDGKAEVIKQPETEEELATYELAKGGCPVEAIQTQEEEMKMAA